MNAQPISLLIFALAAGICGAQGVDISGVVKDPSTGKPMSGVVVSLKTKGLRDTTDGNGEFRLLLAAAEKTPLQRLSFSAQKGFALRMAEKEEVTAEIQNGAGRVVVHGKFALEPGDWSLRPRNLSPGLYTVKLWTGSRLRALRLPIPNSESGRGKPEWVLERADENGAVTAGLNTPALPAYANANAGAVADAGTATPDGRVASAFELRAPAIDSLRVERPDIAPAMVPVERWNQSGIILLPKRAETPARK